MSELDRITNTIAQLEASLATILAAYVAAWVAKSKLLESQDDT